MKTIILCILFNGVIFYSFSQENNEITFQDFEPDIFSYCYLNTTTNPASGDMDSLFLDINFDGSVDLLVYTQINGIMKNPRIKPLNGNISLCYAENDTLTSVTYWTPFGDYWIWSSDTEKFGFKYLIDDQIYYGWFRAYKTYEHNDDGGNTNYLWIDKMAFCTIPNYYLIWGQTSTNGISDVKSPETPLVLKYDNNTGDLLVYCSDSIISGVDIISSSGRLINSKKNINAEYTNINIANSNKGLYIVKVTLHDKTVITDKFVK